MNGTPTETLHLVASAHRGERGALERLFDRYYARLRRIVRARLGERLRADVDSDDIVQETFLAASRRFSSFAMRGRRSLLRWLATLAEHQITDAAHRQNAARRNPARVVRLGSDPDDSTASPGLSVPDRAPTPLDELAHREERELVFQSLRDLEPELRRLIVLRDYARFSWKEIAQRTGRPSPDAARVMHRKAVGRLARILNRRLSVAQKQLGRGRGRDRDRDSA